MSSTRKDKIAFGDFQTPDWFAQQVCSFIAALGMSPGSILEPTCGQGNFLLAALDAFATAEVVVGAEINRAYVNLLRAKLADHPQRERVQVLHADFFATAWQEILADLPEPLLIVGNPPWVTNTALASLGSENLPPKSNFQNRAGMDAMTGASNFDISEWMLQQMMGWVHERPGMVAVLCKTAVARKALLHAWQQFPQTGLAQLHIIDAQAVFGAAVDAGLFIYDTKTLSSAKSCRVYAGLSHDALLAEIGYRHRQLVANAGAYDQWQHLQPQGQPIYRWRSGIKHDCTAVMELTRINGRYVNGAGETCDLETMHLYPLLKSSDLAGRRQEPRRWLLVPQRTVGEDTRLLQYTALRTWSYLLAHGEALDGRKSAIYQNQPRFSIFGVGRYTFASWKVAISGLYKKLDFVIVGPYENKPIVFDDTCYFLPGNSQEEAELLTDLLNSEPARQFYDALIFWDAKRPITAKILNRLDLLALADEVGQGGRLASLREETAVQLMLLEV